MSTFDAAPVQAGTAYVRHDQHGGFNRWTIGNGEFACAIGWLDDRILQLESISRRDSLGVVLHASRELFALTVDETHRLTAETSRVSGVETARGKDWVRLRVHLGSERHGALQFVVECHDGHGVLRQWLEYTADGPVTITGCDGLLLEVADPEAHVVHTVAGVQQQGGWRPEEEISPGMPAERSLLAVALALAPDRPPSCGRWASPPRFPARWARPAVGPGCAPTGCGNVPPARRGQRSWGRSPRIAPRRWRRRGCCAARSRSWL